MSLTVLFQLDLTGSPLQALLSTLENKTALNQAAADAVADGIRDHFVQENTSHKSADALGAQPTGFWGRMSNAVVARATPDAGSVAMPREVAQRYFGGRLVPQGGHKYIALAAIAAAYGKSPRDFPDTHFGFGLNPFGVMQPAMVQDDAQTKVSKTNRGAHDQHVGLGKERTHQVVYFWLTLEVNQPPDPSVLPSQAVMEAYAEHGISEAIASITKGAGDAN